MLDPSKPFTWKVQFIADASILYVSIRNYLLRYIAPSLKETLTKLKISARYY